MAVPIIPKTECYTTPAKKSSSFGLEMNASTLKALSQTLYDYKIEAVVREYSTNITDSHNDSGKEGVAGFVHVPTKLKPVIEFHDKGLGMSEETIFNVYTVFGCSTKRDDNSTNGSLGFGSKAFNTVSDQMTVTSVKDGIKTVVLCYKDRKGELTADVKSSSKTEDENGTVVSIPVELSKVGTWQLVAAKVLGAFRVPHNTNGFGEYQGHFEQVKTFCNEVRTEGSKFYQNPNTAMENLRSNTWVLMGDVLYDLPDFKSLLPNKGDYLEAVEGMVTQGFYVTEFPIGDIDHAPSRETVSYDQDTFMKCKHRIRKDLIKHFNSFKEELGNMKNISYYRFYKKYRNTPIYTTLKDIALPFLKGKTLRYVCPSSKHDWKFSKLLLLANKEVYGKVRGLVPCAGNFRQMFSSSVELFDQCRILNINNPVILYSEKDKGIYKIQETLKNASEDLVREDVLVVDSYEKAQNLLNFFGEGDVLCGDKYSPKKAKRKCGGNSKRGSYGIKEDYHTTGTVYTLTEKGYTSEFKMIDLSEEGTVYLKPEGIKIKALVKGKTNTLTMSRNLSELLRGVGIKRVVVENKNNQGKISRSGVVLIDDVITKTLKPLKRDMIRGSVWQGKYNLSAYDKPLKPKLPELNKFNKKVCKVHPLAEVALRISKFHLDTTPMYQKEMETKRKLVNKVEDSLETLYNRLPLWNNVRTLDEEKVTHYLRLEKIIK